ncbi:SDR family NAD(P)-dependent oxidoreductase [Conexibacter sp. W3-3-2]|nr:SDR family NAD(P)-dependent oxidoreductase [Conexibacter sp. W3-3-2]
MGNTPRKWHAGLHEDLHHANHSFGRCARQSTGRSRRRRSSPQPRRVPLMSRLELRGSTVLITGGGAGIGLALAQECASRGARCALLDINADAAAAAAARLGGGALARAVDVTDLEALEQACGEIAEETGGIDVLVANAGIGPVSTTVDAGDREHQRRVLDVNLHGVWHTLWAGVPRRRASGPRRGHLVGGRIHPGPGLGCLRCEQSGRGGVGPRPAPSSLPRPARQSALHISASSTPRWSRRSPTTR